jgi:hypothetical protein
MWRDCEPTIKVGGVAGFVAIVAVSTANHVHVEVPLVVALFTELVVLGNANLDCAFELIALAS